MPGALLNPALPPTFSLTALQAFNLGLASTYLQAFGDDRVASFSPFGGLYIQDSWKPRPGLTLDFGVRYEVDKRAAPVPTDKNNFAPRFSVAWQLPGDSKTVLRAGYGIFYAPTYFQLDYVSQALNIRADGYRQIGQQFTTIQSPGAASAANIYTTLLKQGIIGVPTPIRSITPADLTQFGLSFAHTGPLPPFALVFDVAPDFVSPYSQQSSLSIEREIGHDLAV